MAVDDYSTTPASNTSISGINIAEGCAPANLNNAIRQLMADVKSFVSQIAGLYYSGTAKVVTDVQGITVSGDTDAARVVIDKTASGDSSRLEGTVGGVKRWAELLGGTETESGSDVGSDYRLKAYDDLGTVIDDVVVAKRAAGEEYRINRPLTVNDTVIALGTDGLKWVRGSGSPEGVITAAVGSLYSRTDGGASTTLYVKQSGTGNTGWVAK